MARVIRTVSPDVFAEHGDFSTQLHDTLRKSPWWMMSIAFHVVLALVLSLFTTTVERQEVVSNSAAFRNTAARSSKLQLDHSRRASMAASTAWRTCSGLAL